MRVLFDNGTPRGVAAALKNHVVEEARSHGWDTFRNGELLDAAEAQLLCAVTALVEWIAGRRLFACYLGV
jgi:hypothetical protein